MNGKILRTVPVIFSVLLLAGTCCAQTRIATVKVNRIFEGYWKTKQADAALRDRQTELDKDMKDMVADYNKTKDEYQSLLADAENQVISAAERDKRKRAAEQKLKDLKDMEDNVAKYRRTASVQLDEQAKRMKDNILNEIRGVAKAKAEAGGFSLVLNTDAETAAGAPVFLYSNNENDITDAVLQQLNSTAPLAPPKTDDSTADSKAKSKDGKK
jgi:outer membrane protein